MNRWITVIFVMILVGSTPLVMALGVIRHVDPAELVEERLFPTSFFALYSGIMSLIGSENWNGSLASLGEASLIYVPANMKFIVSRFSDLLNETTFGLEDTRGNIDNATDLFNRGRLSQSLVKLNEALSKLYSTNKTVNEVESTTQEIGNILKSKPTPLISGVSDIRELMKRYYEDIRELFGVKETVLSIGVNSTSALLGSWLRVVGNLTTVDEKPLPSMEIDIYFDDASVGSALTASDGSYEFMLKIPYIYKENASLYSSFLPNGSNLGPYAPSSSDVLTIQLIYYETVLSIGVNSTSALLGSWLRVVGNLTTVDEKPLPSMEIDIYFDSVMVGNATTTSNGSYEFMVKIPYIYKDEAYLYSSYYPKGANLGPYAPSSSKRLAIKLVYYKPTLSVTAQNVAYPGLNVTIWGNLTLEGGPLHGFEIVISGLDSITYVKTDEEGAFSTNLTVPIKSKTGLTTIILNSLPQQIIGPASAVIEVNVTKVLMLLEVGFPIFALAGMNLTLQGRTTCEGAPVLYSAIVTALDGWSSSTESLEDGSFKVSLYIPLSALTKRYSCSVSAIPSEPWILSSSMDSSILVVNPVYLILPISAVVFATMLVRRGKKPSPRAEVEPLLRVSPLPPVSVTEGGLVGLYRRVVNLVSRYTGVFMEPSHTIREYLGLVKEKLGEFFGLFERLSLVLEKFLYGSEVAGKEEEEAKRSAEKMERGLKDEG